MNEKVEFTFDQGKCDPAEVIRVVEDLDIVSERFSRTAETTCKMVFHRNSTATVILEMDASIFENVYKKFGYRGRLISLGAHFPE